MNLTRTISENKLDQLYDCHDKIEDALNKLHTLFEKADISEEEWRGLQVQFDAVYLELYQLEKELKFS